MLKSCLAAFAAVLVCAGSAAADKIDFDQGVDVKAIVQSLQAQPMQAARAPQAGVAEWTVMVYVNAKNNLESYGLTDVNEMEKVGSTDQVKIAVEFGRIKGYSSADGNWVGQRRYIVAKDADMSKIASPVLQDIPKADMGDWKHLVEFVAWAKQNAPAKRYMLVVWNHGSGWSKARRSQVVINGISYDDESGNHMTTQDMASALAGMGKVEVYASDACLMQMAEIGYQIRDHADYVVGSEETEPADGYTYDTLLGPLSAKPAMSAAELAKLTADAYTAHYASINQGAAQSAVKASALARLLPMLGAWTDAVIAANETAVVKSARSAAQKFYYSDNKDLLHFVRLVDAGTQNPVVKAKGTELERFLKDEVISANAVTGSKYKDAYGLAVYIPSGYYNSAYDGLAWAKDGSYARFAKWIKDIKEDPSNGGGDDEGGWDDYYKQASR
ncbi:MAG: clostripain-related cysteine peptidase [Elusimicrobia bacterium]|nr:clostripain-related cysteine peptidase [Elusimicrobiota bacterium]